MRDCLDVGCAPTHESGAQVGREDYYDRARRECRAYINQLRRVFGREPPGARLGIKSNPHDFGSYLSCVCHFDDTMRETVEYAYRCEAEMPQQWDFEARAELGLPRKEG
jgi:hypothetical protein